MPRLYVDGEAGKIEIMMHVSENPKAPTALVLHPHPLYGGNMNTKIAYHLYKSFVANGMSVARMNFRGVGKSDGEFDGGEGELLDVGTVLNWLHVQFPEMSHAWIAGFSFGSWIAMQSIMRRPEIEAFIAVAPPVSKYNFAFFSPCPISGLILQGEFDQIARLEDTDALVDASKGHKDVHVEYVVVEGADHFFTDQNDVVDETINWYIDARLKNRINKPIVKQRKRTRGRKKKEDS
jgi:alpha/beta superfamily hydrolase